MFDGQMWNSAMESAGAILFSAAWKSTIVLAMAACLTRASCRGGSAALRHGIWSIALAGSLMLPGLEIILPAWELSVSARLSDLVMAASPQSSPAVNQDAPPARPAGSVVAMLEGAALEREMLDHRQADADSNLPLANLAKTSVVGELAHPLSRDPERIPVGCRQCGCWVRSACWFRS